MPEVPPYWADPPRASKVCAVCGLYILEDEPYFYNATDREYRHARKRHCPVWSLLADDDDE